MSSGAEPEDLDLGCSGKTNAGSPEKKSILFLQFFQIYIIEKIFKYESGPDFQYPNLVYISLPTEGHRSLDR